MDLFAVKYTRLLQMMPSHTQLLYASYALKFLKST